MTTFHLAPRGRDRAAGTRQQPWGTLAGARDNLRALRAAGRLTGEATVLVHAGTYPLKETVKFTPADSHTRYVAAPGAAPVFDGGERLTGWQVGERNGRTEWTLDLPEVAAGKRHFRSLFVNGRRAPRARFPKFTPDAKGAQNVLRIGEIKNPERTELFAGSDTFKPKPGDVQAWDSLGDAEFVVMHYWIEERLPRPQLNPRTGWLRFARRSAFCLYESHEDTFGNRALARYYIDNLFEALTEPGEWYLNRETGRLHYLPRPGETPANTEIVAPRLLAFLQASGLFFNDTGDPLDAHATRHVRGLHFAGLAFRHADWFSPLATMPGHHKPFGDDYPIGGSPQAAHAVPGSVSFRAARECSFTDGVIEHAGLYGLEFEEGCRECAAVGNHLHDLGAGGIRASGTDLDGSSDGRTGHLRITDNHIHDIGRIFHQGVGVLLMHAFDCLVAHNHIHHACYTGISLGWTWGYRETPSRNNVVEHNLIHDIGAGILSDMGGIYTLGVQPGTILRGNHLHHIWSHDYGGWGIYLDEGSAHLLVEHNLVHDTKDAPFNIHYGRENVVRHNIFARGQHALASVFRVEGHISATFIQNILYGPSEMLFCGGYQGDIRHALVSNANTLWFPGGRLAPSGHHATRKDAPHTLSWTAWKQAGHDSLSVIADPKLTEGRKTWRLAKNSPALKLGFKPWDWSQCGVRPKGKRTS
ncbi:MAG: right-handed parallel beta-helix repeat-containing protein [Opitutales bacterium]